MTEKLPPHEWLIICLLLSILGSIILIAYIREEPSLPPTDTPHELISSTLQVVIGGAVAKPGAYIMEKGDTIEDLLNLAGPLPEADLRHLRLKRKLRDGQKIKVPVTQMITVILEGAIEKSGPLQVPKGTKVGELNQYIEFSENADFKKMPKKHILQDQEIVSIPEKRKKGKNRNFF